MNRFALSSILALSACGTGTTEGAITAPSELVVAPLGRGLHVTWKDNSKDEDEFAVERKSNGTTFGVVSSVVFDTVQFHDEPLMAGTVYAYRVRAMKNGRGSAYTSEATATAPGGAGGGAAGGGSGGAAGGGTAGGVAGGAAPALPDGGYSFQQHIVPIFNQSCGSGSNSCHSRLAYGPTTGGGCRGWLSLENVALGSKNPTNSANTGCPDRTLWQRLTELDSWMCEPTRKKYVTGRSLGASQLYQSMAGDPSGGGTCNKMPGVPLARMPPAPAPELSTADKKMVETWILQGAPNN